MHMLCDIDSIIVMAHTLWVLDDVEVYVLPYRQQNPDKSGLRPTILLLSFLTHTLGCWKSNLTLLSYFQG